MNNIVYLLNFQEHFQRVFVEFVALLTKIWHRNIDFYQMLQLNVGDNAVQS